MTQKPPLKKFRQLLQEKQEPFELEDYLLERMYSKTNSNLVSGFSCRGGKFGSIKMIRKAFVEISKTVRFSCKKFVSINEKQKTEDLDDDNWMFDVEKGKGCQRVAESEMFSSTRSLSVFGSLSGTSNEATSSSTGRDHDDLLTSDTFRAQEPSNLKLVQDMKTGKLSRIRARLKDSRIGNDAILNKKVPEDSILSATLMELLLYSAATEKTSDFGTTELRELVTSNSTPQLLISKSALLHQTKQLLFDCVREVVETHSKQGRALGSGELRRLICEKMKSLEEDGEEINVSNLLNLDYMESVAEWKDLEAHMQLIGTEMGEIILKEITNEVVIELNDHLCDQ